MLKKYMSLERLQEYDALIKEELASGDSSTLSSAKSYTNTEIAKITNGTTVVPEATHSVSSNAATKLSSAKTISLTGDASGSVSFDGSKDVSISVTIADDSHNHVISNIDGLQTALDGKSSTSHNHDSAYYGKTAGETLADTLTEVKADVDAFFADATISDSAKDTLKEIQDYITSDASAAAEMTASIAGKADKSHTHTIADVANLQTTLNAKAAQTSLDSHTSDTTKHITSTERTNWGTAYTHSQAAHAPSNAEKNQNAFSNVKVGSTTVAADTTTDTLTLVAGTNVQITPDVNADSITISATDTVYTHPNSGVTAGTYRSVTVNALGHVTGGTNPTTLSGYGITDAAAKTHTHAISEITNLQTTLNSTSSAINTNTNSINAHTGRITALETKVGDGFEEITSADIQALFNA